MDKREEDEVVNTPQDDSKDNEDDEGECRYSDDDDDSSLLADFPLLENPGQAPPTKLEQPPSGLTWNDEAISECLHLAVESHDQIMVIVTPSGGQTSGSSEASPFRWEPPIAATNNDIISQQDMEFLVGWKPNEWSLPRWAVDPLSPSFVQTTKTKRPMQNRQRKEPVGAVRSHT